MKKREFLSAAAKLAALAPIGTLAADNRRFGPPASLAPIDPDLANKLRLTFSRASLPTGAWDQVLCFSAGVARLHTSQDARETFSRSPRTYFGELGLRTSPHFEQSREVALARLTMDPAAIAAARDGDYVSFLQRFNAFSLPGIPDAQSLTTTIANLMRNDAKFYAGMKSALESSNASEPASLPGILNQFGSLQVSEVEMTTVKADVYVYTNTFAVTNTTVFSQVVALVAVTISVLAVAVVVVFGVEPSPEFSQYGQISKLDKSLIEGASIATAAARILGNKGFEVRIAIDVIHREIEALFTALEQVGLLQIDPKQREDILQICKSNVIKSLGLTT